MKVPESVSNLFGGKIHFTSAAVVKATFPLRGEVPVEVRVQGDKPLVFVSTPVLDGGRWMPFEPEQARSLARALLEAADVAIKGEHA